MTTLYWVRHGPTHRKDMIGWTDAPADLSDTAALARLSDLLPYVPVISSDLVRAVDTASAIQGSRPRLPHDPDLREIYFGAWEARTGKELNEENPEAMRAFWTDPTHERPPGGESWSDLETRVGRAVDRLLADPPEALIIVAHFGVILSQLRHALGVTVPEVLAHKIDNLSVTTLSHGPEGWQAERINHLA